MAGRGWGTSLATAVGVAAAAGAAQLGLGYGLGVIAWRSSGDPAGPDVWLGGLAWTVWVAASATVLGALVADRATTTGPGLPPARRISGDAIASAGLYGSVRPTTAGTVAWRLLLPFAAALGALLTIPLIAFPARDIHRVESAAPGNTAAGYALTGVLIGAVLAVAALSCRTVALNVYTTGGWLWLVAVAAVVDRVARDDAVTAAPLAIWRFTSDGPSIHGSLYAWDVLLMLGAALLIGAGVAWWGLHRADNRIGVVLSGAAGPVLIAVAYFLAAPSIAPGGVVPTVGDLAATAPDPQLSAYLIAPYAVIVGLAGSVLAVVLTGQSGTLLAATGTPRGPLDAGTAPPDPDHRDATEVAAGGGPTATGGSGTGADGSPTTVDGGGSGTTARKAKPPRTAKPSNAAKSSGPANSSGPAKSSGPAIPSGTAAGGAPADLTGAHAADAADPADGQPTTPAGGRSTGDQPAGPANGGRDKARTVPRPRQRGRG